jgi:hypothetical protein
VPRFSDSVEIARPPEDVWRFACCSRAVVRGVSRDAFALRPLPKHLPAQLTRLRAAISREASAYHKAKDRVAVEAARARALAEGYLEDELDERGWPTTDTYAARARRQRIADRDKQLADGVSEDEIDVDAEGNWKDGRGRDGFQDADVELGWHDDLEADDLDEDLDS